MELEVKRNFIDKENGKLYEKGKKYKFDKKRSDEIIKSPYDLVFEAKKEEKKNVEAESNKESND